MLKGAYTETTVAKIDGHSMVSYESILTGALIAGGLGADIIVVAEQ